MHIKKGKKHKTITRVTWLLLELWNNGCFFVVWFGYYRFYGFDQRHISATLLVFVLYIFLYNALCSVYKGFRIASSPVGETVFAQIVSFGVADLVAYAECCLVYGGIVNIVPGMSAVGLQLLGSALMVQQSKQYFVRHVPPQKTLLVYGKVRREEAAAFCDRILELYCHLFCITDLISEEMATERLADEIRQSEIVLCYELSPEMRVCIGRMCVNERKTYYFTPRLDDILLDGCTPKHLLDTPLMKYEYGYEKRVMYYAIKRMGDVMLSLFLLIVLSPLLLAIAAAIRIEDSGAVIYRQVRCTKDGREFEMLKFRSMVEDAEVQGAALCESGDSRLTRVGRYIRRARLDELPQLINILRGDMSFVGPRPERREFVQQYTRELPEFLWRMRVKGGLTGYAQIYGKYNTSAYDKLRLDMIYIENQSILLDIKLLLLTFRIMFQPEKAEGIERK